MSILFIIYYILFNACNYKTEIKYKLHAWIAGMDVAASLNVTYDSEVGVLKLPL